MNEVTLELYIVSINTPVRSFLEVFLFISNNNNNVQ